jgi:hypothetical protein
VLRVGELLAVDDDTKGGGSAYGGVLLAAMAGGLAETVAERATISATVRPNGDNREVCDGLYGVYRQPYAATRELSQTLAVMQKGGRDVVT